MKCNSRNENLQEFPPAFPWGFWVAKQKQKIHETSTKLKTSTLSRSKYQSSSILYLHQYTVFFIFNWVANLHEMNKKYIQDPKQAILPFHHWLSSSPPQHPSTIKEKTSKPRKEWIKVMLELKKNEKWKPRSFHMILIINVKFGFRCYLLLAKAM